MSLDQNASQWFQGFSKLTRQERYARLCAMGALTDDDVAFLQTGGVTDLDLADKLIENVIGYFQLPLGVATNFHVDGQDYVIPMAVEETSIIAALSKTARWIRQCGEMTTSISGDAIIGQIQFAHVQSVENFSAIFEHNKFFLIEDVNTVVAASMVKRGGGVKDMQLRCISRVDEGSMVVIHVYMDCCDAMGANRLNQVLEYLKSPLEDLTGEQASLCILSNLNDAKLTHATVVLRDIEPELGLRLQEASYFAEHDPYRAATHNKGIMNGIDPVLIATGNDWRAVEAGVHAFAARRGRYEPITTWRYEKGNLIGQLTAPIIVGTVGGVTAIHPTAKLCLRMMGVTSANQLSRIIAAVGIVQNLGAIRALCTDGIIQGHMKLHLDNLALVAGATEDELPLLKQRLAHCLKVDRRVSLQDAEMELSKIRMALV